MSANIVGKVFSTCSSYTIRRNRSFFNEFKVGRIDVELAPVIFNFLLDVTKVSLPWIRYSVSSGLDMYNYDQEYFVREKLRRDYGMNFSETGYILSSRYPNISCQLVGENETDGLMIRTNDSYYNDVSKLLCAAKVTGKIRMTSVFFDKDKFGATTFKLEELESIYGSRSRIEDPLFTLDRFHKTLVKEF